MGPVLLRRVHFLLFALTLAFVPLPLGSNRDWSWSPLAAVVGLLLVLLPIQTIWSGRQERTSLRSLAVPALLVALVALWAVAQASGWTPSAWENPLRISSAALISSSAPHTVALEPEQVWMGLMRLFTYAGVFVLAVVLCSEGSAARTVCAVIVWSAVIYTVGTMVIGVVNRLSASTGVILFTPNPGYFTGPFVNRNHYATYAAVAALAALALATRLIAGRWNDEHISTAARWRRRLTILTGRAGLYFAAIAILGSGVLLSQSRAGLASLALGLLAMLVLLGRGATRLSLIAAAIVAAPACLAFLPGGGAVLARLMTLVQQGDVDRVHLLELTLQAMSLRPLLGWGLNSFQSLYTVFQPTAIPVYYDRAHNTGLELAFALGVPAAAALVIALGWVLVRCVIGVATRRQDREFPALGIAMTLAVGFHSLFDFSLQIPAVAVVCAAVLGIGWAQSWSSRRID